MINESHLQTSLDLANFIHSDREISLEIVSEAIKRLDKSYKAHKKRLYYSSTLKGNEPRRTKILFTEENLLQHLVYSISEKYEKAYEQQLGNISGQTVEATNRLIIHFIKHLIMITMSRNSFHVTLGLCRFLFGYTTPETISTYQHIISYSDDIKDESYWRARKASLLNEISARFGSLISISPASRGHENRIITASASRSQINLSKRCLDLFTPWNTECPILTESWLSDESGGLNSSDLPNMINKDDLSRSHLITHPVCFIRLSALIGSVQPFTKLQLPVFNIS